MPQFYLELSPDLKRLAITYRKGLNHIKTRICKCNGIILFTHDQKLAYVSVPDGILLRKLNAEYYDADAVYIDRIIDMTEHPEYHNICLRGVERRSSDVQYIPTEFQTEEICRIVLQYERGLEYITNQTKQMCETEVLRSGFNIKHVKPIFRSRELCEMAVRQHGCAIECVSPEFITATLCKLAIRQNWRALQYVPAEFKTYDLCVDAVARCSSAVQFL